MHNIDGSICRQRIKLSEVAEWREELEASVVVVEIAKREATACQNAWLPNLNRVIVLLIPIIEIAKSMAIDQAVSSVSPKSRLIPP